MRSSRASKFICPVSRVYMLRALATGRRAAATVKPHKCRVAVAPRDAALICHQTGGFKWDKVAGLDRRILGLQREKAALAEREERVRWRYTLPPSAEELERRAVLYFRHIFYRAYREFRGNLYDLMLLLYVGELRAKEVSEYDMSLLDRVRSGSVPDAWDWLHTETKARNRVRAFALDECFLGAVEESRKPRGHLGFKDLTAGDVSSLLHALHQPESLLAKLMQPDPLLTHHENFHTALEHARLFLLRSELPIRFGLDVTYRDLANQVLKCGFPDCREKSGATTETLSEAQLLSAKDRLESPWFPFPSATEARLRRSTITKHLQALEEPHRRVEHQSPADCPAEAHLLVKRVMRTRNPFLMGDKGDYYMGWKEVMSQLDEVDGSMEDSEHEIYGEWTNESPELRALFLR